MTSPSFLNTYQINGQEYNHGNADHRRQAEAECFDHLWQKHSVGNLILAMASFGIALIFRKMHFENEAKSLVEKTVIAKQQLDRLTPEFKQSLNLQGSLNKQWRETVAPQLMKCTSHSSRFRDLSAAAIDNYNFGAVVSKIKNYQAQGKRVCLFIGRTPNEPLPSNSGEAKENEVWVSADLLLLSPEQGRRIETPSDRLHLWLDFNQQEGLNLVKGLFQKVVIDISTTKAFDSDFVKRFSVLLQPSQPQLQSQIIFENCAKTSTQLMNTAEKESFNVSSYCLIIPGEVFIKQQTDRGPDGFDNWAKDLSTKCLTSHLKRLYHKVEKCNYVYPYRNNYTEDNEIVDYFVVSDPITVS